MRNGAGEQCLATQSFCRSVDGSRQRNKLASSPAAERRRQLQPTGNEAAVNSSSRGTADEGGAIPRAPLWLLQLALRGGREEIVAAWREEEPARGDSKEGRGRRDTASELHTARCHPSSVLLAFALDHHTITDRSHRSIISFNLTINHHHRIVSTNLSSKTPIAAGMSDGAFVATANSTIEPSGESEENLHSLSGVHAAPAAAPAAASSRRSDHCSLRATDGRLHDRPRRDDGEGG